MGKVLEWVLRIMPWKTQGVAMLLVNDIDDKNRKVGPPFSLGIVARTYLTR